jgi:subtilase family serine protease
MSTTAVLSVMNAKALELFHESVAPASAEHSPRFCTFKRLEVPLITRFRIAPIIAASAFALGSGVAGAASPDALIGVGPLGSLRDLGRAPAATRVDVAVVLRYRNDAELEALVRAQGDPDSPVHGRFLTQGQVQRYFSPTRADESRVIASLERAGFTVTQRFANRTVVDASAPAPVAERYFATEIHRLVQPGEGIKYANVRPGFVPAALQDVVLGVTGLSSVHVAHSDHVFGPRPVQLTQAIVDAKPLFGPDGGYGPGVFTKSYHLPAGKGMTGTGRASGVAIDADFLDGDLAGYLNFFKVTRTGPATTRVLVDGGPPKGITQDSVETTLDVETIVSLAPGTSLFVYEFPSFTSGVNTKNIVDTYNKIVQDNKVDTVNSSFGLCEIAFGTFPKMADKIALAGAAEGITFHASTGDSGNYTFGCSSNVSVDAPAIAPHFVAVGGTILTVNHTTGAETSETGWNDSSGATGGGVSVLFKLPGYQKGVTNVITSGRNDPDLSFDASPFTGESFFFQGIFQGPIGGTSLSSPIFGAAMTEVAQVTGKRAGFVNPSIYKEWKALGYKSAQGKLFFRDVTQGVDGRFNALVGYDQMTGIGAMDVLNFGPHLP